MGNLIGREKEVKELTELYILAFEGVCFRHIRQIKQALGILGVS